MEIQYITHDLSRLPTKIINKDNKEYNIIIIPLKIVHAKAIELDREDSNSSPIMKSNFRFSDDFSTENRLVMYCSAFTTNNDQNTMEEIDSEDNANFYFEFGFTTYVFCFTKDNRVFIWILQESPEPKCKEIDLMRGFIIKNEDSNKYSFYDLVTLETIIFRVPEATTCKNNIYFNPLPNGELDIVYEDKEDENNTIETTYILDKSMTKVDNFLLLIKEKYQKKIPRPIQKMIINIFYEMNY